MVKIYKRVHFFCLFAFVFCQTGIPATGKVVNIRTGVGIVGVDLTIINSNIGTVTDTAGFFNLEWTDHYPIRIQASHIGYEIRTIVVLKPGNIWIGLNPAVLKGEEVIVVGEQIL